MYFSHLQEKKLPWMYGLRFDEKTFSLHLDLSLQMFDFIDEYLRRFADGFAKVASDNGYKTFTFILDKTKKSFGYGDVATSTYSEESMCISFPLKPKGKDQNEKKHHHFKVCRTLSVLLDFCQSFLSVKGEELVPKEQFVPQLFEVVTVISSGMHGYCLGGFVSPQLRSFLSDQGNLDYEESRIFRDAFVIQIKKLFGYNGQAILVFESDGGFLIQVPGNACDIGIYGDERSHPIKEGAEFQSHNVDVPQQQIGLLIGLAMILGWYYEKHPEDKYWKQ